MNKTLIIGAGGKVGKILVPRLLKSGHSVVAMVRDSGKYRFQADVEVVEGDLEGEIQSIISRCNRVVFTAGSGAATGPDKTLLVDLWGAAKAIDAAGECGVQHFVMVSSIGADNPDRGPRAIKPYLVAKHFADEYLIRSGLHYTILRPGRLTDEAGEGLITTTRPSDAKGREISREDTANVVGYCLDNTIAQGKIYELYKGSEPIGNAIT